MEVLRKSTFPVSLEDNSFALYLTRELLPF